MTEATTRHRATRTAATFMMMSGVWGSISTCNINKITIIAKGVTTAAKVVVFFWDFQFFGGIESQFNFNFLRNKVIYPFSTLFYSE